MGFVLTLIGGSIAAASTIEVAKAEAKALKRQALQVEAKGALADIRTVEEAERKQSGNIVSITKSGVQLDGSPNAVLARNAFLVDRERTLALESVSIRANQLRDQARVVKRAAQFAAASGIFGVGGTATSQFSASRDDTGAEDTETVTAIG